MPEQLPQNCNMVNVLAKAKLKEAGQQADPTSLYVLQLMRWGLDSGKVALSDDLQGRVSQTLDNLVGYNPDRVMRFLLLGDAGDETFAPASLAKQTPEEASAQLLDVLESRMSATFADYPRANPLP